MVAIHSTSTDDTHWALDFLRASGAAAQVRKGIWSLRSVRPDGWALKTKDGLTIIISGGVELDGRRWLHCSVSRPDRMPTYDDLDGVKRIVFGPDREAYQKFARRREHVNMHAFCLHLWHCLDGDRLPDFTRGGRSI